jgi:hypothetical protein
MAGVAVGGDVRVVVAGNLTTPSGPFYDAFHRERKTAVALHFAHYNFVRIHPSWRVTPAMAAGVSDRLIEELIDIAIDGRDAA